MTKNNYFKEVITIVNYFYCACGENVISIQFTNNSDAWNWVNSHYGYDCVVESRY